MRSSFSSNYQISRRCFAELFRHATTQDEPAVVPVQAIFARASRVELQSGLTLVRESSMPVGSVSTTYLLRRRQVTVYGAFSWYLSRLTLSFL